MELEILSTAKDLHLFGGMEKVLKDVHEGIKPKYKKARVLGFVKYENLHPKYNISRDEYVKFKSPFYLNNKVLIVHGRNIMAFFMMLKKVFMLNTKILYVHHNVYDNLKQISFFPKDIISISGKVTDNLVEYFGLKGRDIQLIYNGIKDEADAYAIPVPPKEGKIKILYAARVNEVKRQLQIVEQLDGKLLPGIEIHFAGTGTDYEALKKRCSNSTNFFALGFIENMNSLIAETDYLMLFSKQEGLPITLIEGAMHGKPLLVNDVGGNIDIGVPGENGILLSDDWDKLAGTLNALTKISDNEYMRMGVNSRNRYKTMFTYDSMILSYINKIEQMVNN